MCITSFIGQDWTDKLPYKQPPTSPWVAPSALPGPPIDTSIFKALSNISRKEFDELREEVKQLKELLVKAKQYDVEHSEPDCEIEEKVALIKNFGEVFSIDFNDVFDNETALPNTKDSEIFRVISQKYGTPEIARFEDKLLADKFADYITRYNNDNTIIVLEVHPIKLETLRYAVFVNDTLAAAFVEYNEAVQYVYTVADAADIFSPAEPRPEIAIKLI